MLFSVFYLYTPIQSAPPGFIGSIYAHSYGQPTLVHTAHRIMCSQNSSSVLFPIIPIKDRRFLYSQYRFRFLTVRLSSFKHCCTCISTSVQLHVLFHIVTTQKGSIYSHFPSLTYTFPSSLTYLESQLRAIMRGRQLTVNLCSRVNLGREQSWTVPEIHVHPWNKLMETSK